MCTTCKHLFVESFVFSVNVVFMNKCSFYIIIVYAAKTICLHAIYYYKTYYVYKTIFNASEGELFK